MNFLLLSLILLFLDGIGQWGVSILLSSCSNNINWSLPIQVIFLPAIRSEVSSALSPLTIRILLTLIFFQCGFNVEVLHFELKSFPVRFLGKSLRETLAVNPRPILFFLWDNINFLLDLFDLLLVTAITLLYMLALPPLCRVLCCLHELLSVFISLLCLCFQVLIILCNFLDSVVILLRLLKEFMYFLASVLI